MPTFPRRGTELSTAAALKFGSASYERLGNVVEFENKWKERSAIGLTGRYGSIPVTAVVNATDMAVILAFLQARSLFVEVFDLVHPRLGTIPVHYVGDQLPLPLVVDGNPAWYKLDMQFEGEF